jgi:predicted RecB family nuclease
MNKTKKVCAHGHFFYKSSNCETCPICEAAYLALNAFLNLLSAPARRALENAKIDTLEILSTYSETQILKLHGIGKASLPVLKDALASSKLRFKLE